MIIDEIIKEACWIGKIANEHENYDLKSKYNFFNQSYFNNELPNDLPVVWNSRLKNVGGQSFPIKKDGKWVAEKITINNTLKLSELQLDTILVHEMIHAILFQRQNNVNVSRHHQGDFIEEAKRIQRINPKIHAEGKFLSDIGENVENIEKNKLEQIPIYAFIICYDTFSVGTCTDQCWFFSYGSDVNDKILNNKYIKKELESGYRLKVGFLYKINTNTVNFMYNSFVRVLDKDLNFGAAPVKRLVSLIKKDKINTEFISKTQLKKDIITGLSSVMIIKE